MKRRVTIAAVVVLEVAGFAFAAQQSQGPGWGRASGENHDRSMSQRILALLDNVQFQSAANLTNDQVGQLRKIFTNAEKANIQTRAQMQVDGINLRQLLQADKPDQSAVMKKVQEISELRGQMMKNNVQALLKAKALLSPEQQERVRQFIGERFRDRGLGQGRMQHNRGGTMTRPGTPPSPPDSPAPPAPQSQ